MKSLHPNELQKQNFSMNDSCKNVRNGLIDYTTNIIVLVVIFRYITEFNSNRVGSYVVFWILSLLLKT